MYVIHYRALNPNTDEWRDTYTNSVSLVKVVEYLTVIETDDGLSLVKVEPA